MSAPSFLVLQANKPLACRRRGQTADTGNLPLGQQAIRHQPAGVGSIGDGKDVVGGGDETAGGKSSGKREGNFLLLVLASSSHTLLPLLWESFSEFREPVLQRLSSLVGEMFWRVPRTSPSAPFFLGWEMFQRVPSSNLSISVCLCLRECYKEFQAANSQMSFLFNNNNGHV